MGPPMRKHEGEEWTAPDVLKGWKNGREKNEGNISKKTRAGFFSGDLGVLDRDADDESWTLIRENALWTVPMYRDKLWRE
ncbi:hypothetical protein TNCV_3835011 [Trichonephila clavipes]|nr:hypothetical protein TNCV_3835011 [Trichonephila clavipes]